LKVLLIHNTYRQPGGEDVVVAQEQALLERFGHRVLSYQRSNHELTDGSHLTRIAQTREMIWSHDAHNEVAALIRQERPDVAHVHNTFLRISPSVYSACATAGVPVVQTLHNFRLLCPAANFYRAGLPCEECAQQGLWRGVQHACYRGSRAATAAVALMLHAHRRRGTWQQEVSTYIALNHFSREKFVAGGLPEDRVVVKPNFVYPDPGYCDAPGEYAVFAGRLSPEKGPHMLLDAWEQMPARVPLLIIGDGPLRRELQARAIRGGLAHVSFAGRLSRWETMGAIRSARFLLLPSQCYENFPMTVAEAMACGTPVIASRLGAMQEIIEEGRAGLLVSPGDSAELAGRVQWLWSHPRTALRMRREARARFERDYTAERNYELLAQIYQQSTVAAHRGVRVPPQPQRHRFRVLGVPVDAVQIPAAVARMKKWIDARSAGSIVAVTGMHGVMEAQHDAGFKQILASADLVVADGMPLVWLGRWYGHDMPRRVYGPELLDTFCRETGDRYRHFFYGGASGVAAQLARVMHDRHGIQIAGVYAPPFRPLTGGEEEELAACVRAAAPDVLWVGLSTPKQERWMSAHVGRLPVPVLVGVGAAFDFATGRVRQAPQWMREHGLEWLFRLLAEPRRLWRRYVLLGSRFVWSVSLEMLGVRKYT